VRRQKTRSQRIASEIASAAKARYGELKRRKVRPPLDQLIQSVLWRHTSVRRGTRALRELKRNFVDWNEVRVSSIGEISGVMSAAGWAKPSAERIRRILSSLFVARNVVSLDFLSELTAAQARAFLQSLQEVTRDLADEVLLFSLQADVLPLSQETAVMCYRLGLIRNERATLQNQRALMALWDRGLYPAVTLFFVDYARSVCRPDKPRHSACPVGALCPKVGI